MAFTFIHTADVHLDSPLKSLAMRDPALAELVGNATRTSLQRLVDLCISEKVDALLIAGDLYDGAQTSMKTARFLAQQMERLANASIPVFMIRGNHDASSKITRELVLPDLVHIFSDDASPVEVQLNGHDVALHGISFRMPHAPESLLDKFAPPLPGAFNIGLLHTSLGGALGHDAYAPCSLGDLQKTRFDYWALGHIHKRSVFAGKPTVVMPGIPQGRDIGESGLKSVTHVAVSDSQTVEITERALSVARFEPLSIECAGVSAWSEFPARITDALRQARRDLDGEHLILRLHLTGHTPLAWRALRDADILLAQARNAAETLGTVWIDKIELSLTDETEESRQGPVAEITRLITDDEARPDPALAQHEMTRLLNKLPRDMRSIFGDDEIGVASRLQDNMQLGAREVLTRLSGSDED